MTSDRSVMTIASGVLIALAVAASVADAQGDCVCQGNTTCTGARLTCANGGNFAPGTCQSIMRCPGQEAATACRCPMGYSGVACEIIKPEVGPAICGSKGLVYDDQMLNTAAAKYIECQADHTDVIDMLNLQDHRINVTMDLPERQMNVQLWTRLDTNGMCGPMVQYFDCTVSDCSFYGNVTEGKTTVSCPTKTCKWCKKAEGCSPLVGSLIKAFEDTTVPLTLTVDMSQAFTIKTTVHMTADKFQLDLPVTCRTGACVTKKQFIPDNAPQTPTSSSSVAKMVFCSSLAIAMYVLLAGAALFVNWELRSPPPVIRAMILDHSHDKPHLVVNDSGIVDDDYNRLSTSADSGGVPVQGEEHSSVVEVADAQKVAHPNGRFGLVWHDVHYRFRARRDLCGRRHQVPPILCQNSGVVRPGEMVAILGASGAGKSTLLDILGGIDKKGLVSGYVGVFGDHHVKRRDIVSYVVQDDYNLATMTVWETLAFSARMRLPSDTTDHEIMLRVRHVIEELALVKVATSKVGTVERGGISGGERRRLAVGGTWAFAYRPSADLTACVCVCAIVELVAEPRVLLADEPTSGLDSYYADMLVRTLRRRAVRDQCAVLLTIHQPPAHLFPLFHKVVLMCKGGTMAFNGRPADAITFFEQQTGTTMPPGANPFEFLVEALSNRSKSFNAEIVRSFAQSDHHRVVQDEVTTCRQSKDVQRTLPKRSTTRISMAKQVSLLTVRAFRNVARDPSLLLMYNCVTMGVAVLVGLVFYRLTNDLVGAQNRAGFMFFTVLFMSLLNMSSMGHFVLDRILLWRERFAGFYTIGPYFASKIIVDLVPFRILPPILYASVSYWLVGLQPDAEHFLRFTAVLVLTNLMAGALVFFISAASGNIGQANLVGILVFIYAMVFGGLLLNPGSTNSILSGLTCTSFINYAYENLLSNELHGLPMTFDPKGFGVGVSVAASGDAILDNLSFSFDHFEKNMLILSSAFAFVTLATYVVLKQCQRRRK
ncbi:hypothetical protein PBRA_009105 [Plasmodiophora brassicae]|uniref:ABC transporter domain-containing protein n=1 Tax=Plasmodiophora brassicae TaxID=37360 RepID=A0A0G4J5E4_PLABS|nr:hypothetical protein PBRA_009105 [Plasmodiophora brassicae]